MTTPAYEATAEEQSAVRSFAQKMRKSPGIKLLKREGRTTAMLDHADEMVGVALLANATGANDLHFLAGVIEQLNKASLKNGASDENGLNFMLSVIKGIEPRDQIEAMLATQMAVVQAATMKAAAQRACANNILQRETAERSLSKLIRAFAMLVEALKRHPAGGEQKMNTACECRGGRTSYRRQCHSSSTPIGSEEAAPAKRNNARTEQAPTSAESTALSSPLPSEPTT